MGAANVPVPICATDDRTAEASSLTYTTAPMTSTVQLAGLISADIYASYSRTDGMLSTTLTAVSPDGTSQPLKSGWLRASNAAVSPQQSVRAPDGTIVLPFHPDTQAASKSVVPGAIGEYQVQINPDAAVIPAGDRLRLVVSVTDAAVLPSAAQTADEAGETMTVYEGPSYPSRVIVPLVPSA